MSFIKKISVLSLTVVALTQSSFACEHRPTPHLCDLGTTSRPAPIHHGCAPTLADQLHRLDSLRTEESRRTAHCCNTETVKMTEFKAELNMLPHCNYRPAACSSTLSLFFNLSFQAFIKFPCVFTQQLIRKHQARLSMFDGFLGKITHL